MTRHEIQNHLRDMLSAEDYLDIAARHTLWLVRIFDINGQWNTCLWQIKMYSQRTNAIDMSTLSLSHFPISIKTTYIFLDNHNQTFKGNISYYKIRRSVTCHVQMVHNRRDPYLSMIKTNTALSPGINRFHMLIIYSSGELQFENEWQITGSTKPYTQGNTLYVTADK